MVSPYGYGETAGSVVVLVVPGATALAPPESTDGVVVELVGAVETGTSVRPR